MLRTFAVLAVYLGHLLQLWDFEHLGLVSAKALSQAGVLLFFVHTSLVLLLSMDRMELSPSILWKSFYLRRLFRIFPLSIVAVLAAVAGSVPPFPTHPYVWIGWSDIIANLALVQNLTQSPLVLDPLWSLPYEVQMYVLLPPIFWLLAQHPHRGVLAILWLGAVLLATLQMQSTFGRLGIVQYAPCFLAGAVAFGLRRSQPRFPFAGWPAVIFVAFALRQLGLEAGWLACLLLGLTVAQFHELRLPWLKLLARLIARYSYGIYLSHLFVFWIVFVQLEWLQSPMQAVLCGLLSIGLPVVLYHLIERPMMNAGIAAAGRLGWTPR